MAEVEVVVVFVLWLVVELQPEKIREKEIMPMSRIRQIAVTFFKLSSFVMCRIFFI